MSGKRYIARIRYGKHTGSLGAYDAVEDAVRAKNSWRVCVNLEPQGEPIDDFDVQLLRSKDPFTVRSLQSVTLSRPEAASHTWTTCCRDRISELVL